MNNQEELFNQEPIKDVAALPKGETDKLEPFESIDPYTPLIPTSPQQYMEQLKRGLVFQNTVPVDNSKAIMGIDPVFNDLVTEGSCVVMFKEGTGENTGKMIAEYLGRDKKEFEIQFPDLLKQLKYYNADMITEEKQRAYIGIDNGISGSIGIIYEDGTHEFFKTPTNKAQDYTKAKQQVTRVKPLELTKILSKAGLGSMVILERPMVNPKMFKNSMSAMRCFEATITILETLNLPYEVIDSKEWQRDLLPKGTAGEELKKASLDMGNRLFPNTKLVNHPDCDGMMIAKYCKIKHR